MIDLQDLVKRYSRYPVDELSYGTVQDYCDSFDHLQSIATANGDLKDCQRPWTLKAVISKTRRPGRLLEIGAGEPIVANVLQQLGHEVFIVDPYDGSANGPTSYEQYRARYPKLKFIRSAFSENVTGIEESSLDCIYSISVLEHFSFEAMTGMFAGARRFLKKDAVTVHSIDHVHRGNGAAGHLSLIRLLTDGFGIEPGRVDQVLSAMNFDTETYYLSAESHNRWRGQVPYEQFPMRVCVSIQIATPASKLKTPG